MKKTILGSFVIFTITLLSPKIILAQGTIFVSNLGQTPAGSSSIGSDSWVASEILTGNNAAGYSLNSVQLGMTTASGNPSSFNVMIYSAIIGFGINPGSSLGALTGSLSPVTSGIYTYSPASSLILAANTHYFIVLTAGTAVANGAYNWNFQNTLSYNPSGGWGAGGVWKSSDGSTWLYNSGGSQFALYATAVPEPSSGVLLGFGGLILFVILSRRRSPKAS